MDTPSTKNPANQDVPQSVKPAESPTPITTPPESAQAPTVIPGGPTKKSKTWLWLLIAGLIIILGAGAAYYAWHTYAPTAKQTTSSTAQTAAPPTPKICAVVYGYLVCTDKNGSNPVRYNLPLLNGQQVASLTTTTDQSEFVAYSSGTGVLKTQVWLLNSKLKTTKQLSFPSTYIGIGSPSLSSDGKSIVLELDTGTATNQDRGIYRYTLSTKKLTPLTVTPTQDGRYQSPQETKDGHILYSHYAPGSAGWLPYIMNNDGTDQQSLPGVSMAGVLQASWDYDASSDTVYVVKETGSGYNPDFSIVYGTVADLLKGGTPQSISSTDIDKLSQITHIDSGTVSIGGKLISLSTGKQVGAITALAEGSSVGWLTTAAFTRSSSQTVQPHDHIGNLGTVSSDFKSFIEQFYDTQNPGCVSANTAGAPGLPASLISPAILMTIQGEVRNTFASVSFTCAPYGDQIGKDYIKVNGVWTEAKSVESQGYPLCEAVNQYKFTKELIPQCYNSNKVVANTNP